MKQKIEKREIITKEKLKIEKREDKAEIRLGMTNQNIIKRFIERYGGSYRIECVQGNRKPLYRWVLGGNKQVPRCLEKIYPYLYVKREHAKIVFDFVSKLKRLDGNEAFCKTEIGRREDLYLLIKELNSGRAPATTEREGTREGEATVWTALKNAEDSRNDYPATLRVVNK